MSSAGMVGLRSSHLCSMSMSRLLSSGLEFSCPRMLMHSRYWSILPCRAVLRSSNDMGL